ncbi:MAG TPA: hypothetical protein VFA50_01040 [Stellaceae bacterium]|nr:hypothetical protein [Stellaceae bacterium]
MPSYARQTGQECAACHNGFPELTPYGRLFKLNGYTFGGGTSEYPPVAAMLVPSFTHTQAGQPGGAAPHFGANNNFTATGSLFYWAGAITRNIGSFTQATYDYTTRRFSWDNTDLRFADTTSVLGRELVFGASLNNNPTVSDIWNSTPAFGFPFLSSELAPTPAAKTLIEGGLAQKVVGATAYGYWGRLVYAEAGLYRGLSVRSLTTLGIDSTGTDAIKNVAPYWRLAVEPKWGQSSLELGTFGLAVNRIPGRVREFGTDHIVDVGIDSQYQFLGARDSFSVQARWIAENDNFTASQATGGTTNSRDHLRSWNAKATYYYDQTYGLTLGYFNIAGSDDPALYTGSAAGSPNSRGWIGELDYIPFNHGGPSFWPWLNVKLGLQYVYYERFNGGQVNFDGAGRNAHDNNTIFAFAWIAF